MKNSELQNLAKKMEQLYPVGAKVNWSGEFFVQLQKVFQSGTGTVTGHIMDNPLGFIWISILTDSNTEKQFVIADIDNEKFEPKGISLA